MNATVLFQRKRSSYTSAVLHSRKSLLLWVRQIWMYQILRVRTYAMVKSCVFIQQHIVYPLSGGASDRSVFFNAADIYQHMKAWRVYIHEMQSFAIGKHMPPVEDLLCYQEKRALILKQGLLGRTMTFHVRNGSFERFASPGFATPFRDTLLHPVMFAPFSPDTTIVFYRAGQSVGGYSLTGISSFC